jgi:hypothetical protein
LGSCFVGITVLAALDVCGAAMPHLPALDPYRRAIVSAPLVLEPRHSIDFLEMDGAITDEEIAYTVSLWQAAEFHVDGTSAFGYAPGEGTQVGARHSADVDEPAWSLSVAELNRQLAAWRAGRYRENTNAWDGFAPVWSQPYELDERLSGAIIMYVDGASPTPTPPYDSLMTAAHTIQEAVDLAVAGTVIRVAPGIYGTGAASTPHGQARVVLTNAVVLESLEGPERTAIIGQADPPLRGVIMDHPEAVLRGFTVAAGKSPGSGDTLAQRNGGGILGLALTSISDCRIIDSSALPWGSGGGMALHSVSGVVQRIELSGNEAYAGGGVIVLWGQNTHLEQARVYGNAADVFGGGLVVDNSRRIRNVLAYDNQASLHGGGVVLWNNADLWNATVTRNSAPAAAGVMFLGQGSRVFNSIITSNQGGNIHAADEVTAATVAHVCSTAITHAGIAVSNLLESVPGFMKPAVDDFRILDPQDAVLGIGLFADWMVDGVDLDGAPRLTTDGTVSLGAYERGQTVVTLTAPETLTAGETFDLDLRVQWRADVPLGALAFAFDLPANWHLEAVTGDAAPALKGNELVFLGENSGSIVTAVVAVVTDSLTTGEVTVDAAVSWQLFGMSETVTDDPVMVTMASMAPQSELQVRAFAGSNGLASPELQTVSPGESASVLVEADAYHYIEDLRVDSNVVTEALGQESFTVLIDSVTAETDVYVSFAPYTTVYDVPLHWLSEYGLTNQVPEDAVLEDHDGDGVPTWKEFIAGTSPVDSGNVFVLDAIHEPESMGASSLVWSSVSGRVYHVYRTYSLTDPDWTTIGLDIPATPPVNIYPLPESVSEAFYRISVQLAP